ncbi:MAG: helix-turn-helix domain-containing protein [Phascolarctobacterium faecium]
MDNIGEILKNTRLDKGLSLEQVEEATSIRKIYLAAIETGDYAKIPGDVFTKGIIRTYGNYLGLNGPELVTLYKAACAGVDPEEIKPAEIRTTSKISVAPHLKPQKFFEYFTYLLSFVLLVIIAAAGYIFLFSSSDQPENIVTPNNQL